MAQPQVGSIIGFSGKDYESDLINLCSLGIPRHSIHHVGIVGQLHGQLLLYESKGLCDAEHPCYRAGKPVSGVQAHRLEEVIDEAKATRIWHYPIRRDLYNHEIERLLYFLDSKLGVKYDVKGAIRSGGFLTRLVAAKLKDESEENLFCSELVCDALVHIGVFQTNNISMWSPNRLMRTLLADGVVNHPKLLKDC